MDIYKACTGRNIAPQAEFKELWCIAGRRSGKSFMASIVAVYLALFFKYDEHLAPGEVGTIQVIASDRSQAQVIFKYCRAILNSNPVFKQYITNELTERIDLSNQISIEVMACSYRSIRGRSIIAGVFDEASFWMAEGQNPSREILSAIRPGMATIPNSKLIVVSSRMPATESFTKRTEITLAGMILTRF